MKKAVCHKCGKKLRRPVPDDAEEVTCFDCDQREWNRKDREAKAKMKETP